MLASGDNIQKLAWQVDICVTSNSKTWTQPSEKLLWKHQSIVCA